MKLFRDEKKVAVMVVVKIFEPFVVLFVTFTKYVVHCRNEKRTTLSWNLSRMQALSQLHISVDKCTLSLACAVTSTLRMLCERLWDRAGMSCCMQRKTRGATSGHVGGGLGCDAFHERPAQTFPRGRRDECACSNVIFSLEFFYASCDG